MPDCGIQILFADNEDVLKCFGQKSDINDNQRARCYLLMWLLLFFFWFKWHVFHFKKVYSLFLSFKKYF